LRHHPAQLVIVPHVDPSWGVLHPVADLARICHRQDAWLLVDARLSLGGCELRTDDWQLDGVAAGVDACLGGPSGMALVTFSQALEQRMLARRAPPTTSYLDLLQLRAYWSPERLNHHTAPTSLVYGLREALRLLSLEGLEATWQRHRQVGDALMAGLKALGFAVPGEVTSRAPHMCVVRPPEGVPADEARWRLLDEFGVYVGRGPDETWRIGLLGADARHESALRLLAALEQVRLSYGQAVEPGAARREALATLASQPAQPAQPAPPAQAAW
jgi:(S)-ureidoglycine-glyoxylate aminotransferase